MTRAPKRRWFQFSLRGIFLLLTVMAIMVVLGPTLYQRYSKWQEQREFDALAPELIKTVKPQTSGPYP